VFKDKRTKVDLSEYMTEALEAFIVVVYVNCFASWKSEWLSGLRKKAKGQKIRGKQATGARTKNSSPTAGATTPPGSGGQGQGQADTLGEVVSPSTPDDPQNNDDDALEEEPEVEIVPKKFTSSAKGRGKYKGWSKEGIELYNEIQRVIGLQRKVPSSMFDEEFMEYFKEHYEDSSSKKGKREEEVRARNSLMGSGGEDYNDESSVDGEDEEDHGDDDSGTGSGSEEEEDDSSGDEVEEEASTGRGKKRQRIAVETEMHGIITNRERSKNNHNAKPRRLQISDNDDDAEF
jgi:hypothetical protein